MFSTQTTSELKRRIKRKIFLHLLYIRSLCLYKFSKILFRKGCKKFFMKYKRSSKKYVVTLIFSMRIMFVYSILCVLVYYSIFKEKGEKCNLYSTRNKRTQIFIREHYAWERVFSKSNLL